MSSDISCYSPSCRPAFSHLDDTVSFFFIFGIFDLKNIYICVFQKPIIGTIFITESSNKNHLKVFLYAHNNYWRIFEKYF